LKKAPYRRNVYSHIREKIVSLVLQIGVIN